MKAFFVKTYRKAVFLIILGLSSCDNTDDFVSSFNTSPEVRFYYKDHEPTHVLVVDAKQSGLVGQFPLEFRVEFFDINNNLSDDAPILSDSSLRFFTILDQTEVPGSSISLIEVSKTSATFEVNMIFVDSDTFEIEVSITDAFDIKHTGELVVRVFDNKLPELGDPVITENDLNSRIRNFDLSDSRDTDEDYGGYIESYHFILQNDTFSINRPQLTHSFSRVGDHPVSFFVRDNNLEDSEPVSRMIMIE